MGSGPRFQLFFLILAQNSGIARLEVFFYDFSDHLMLRSGFELTLAELHRGPGPFEGRSTD